MAITPIKRPLYGPDGTFLPPAPVELALDVNWLNSLETTRIPTWLTASGTVAYNNQPTARAGLKITSATGSGSKAALATAVTVDTGFVEAVRWDLYGFESSAEGPIGMGLAGASGKGLYISQGNADDAARFRWGNGSGDLMTKFRFRGDGVALSRRNLSLLSFTRTGSSYMLQNNQVVAFVENPAAYAQGVIAADVSVTAPTFAAVTMTLQRACLTVWQS
jgi:hypothetical protein